ncbi:MAG: acyl-CoA/acyl-ACP dehydrogenase [Burkholderiales bacterium]|nr:acyl-CoA/acyl-ACP dehydrogenase [Burkholderiales bacterium]
MFELTPEQQAAVESFRRFAGKRLRPAGDLYEKAGRPPAREATIALFREIEPFGVLGALVADDDGGSGIGMVTLALLVEEIARNWLGFAFTVSIQAAGAGLVSALGTPEQKARLLPGILRGDVIPCMGISEPEVGSNVAEVKTRAVEDGHTFVVSGQKLWISNGDIADFVIAVARTGEGELSYVIVEREAHGFTTRPIAKMALHSTYTSEVYIDGARVPKANLLGERGKALKQTVKLFERPRTLLCMCAVGVAQDALEQAVEYAKQRKQHGKPIAGHQTIQNYLAEMVTGIHAARLLGLRAALMIDRDQRCDMEAAMAKYFGPEMAVRATSAALQIHGGFGVTEEYRVSRLFREARIIPIPDGTTEIQKLIIGRALTGVNAFN